MRRAAGSAPAVQKRSVKRVKNPVERPSI